MRAAPSLPEQLLWAALTNGKLGVSFRRQVPLGGYAGTTAPLVLNYDGSAEIFAAFYDVSFANLYDVNSAPNMKSRLLA